MKKHRLLLVKIGLAAGIFFLLGFLGRYETPKIKSWVLVEIENLTQKHAPIRVLPGAVHLHVFPIGATLENVKLFPKEEISAFLSPVELKSVRFNISFFQLLQGHLRFNELQISGAAFDLAVPKTKKADGSPLEGFFKTLDSIPIELLHIDDVNIRLALPAQHAQVTFTGINLDSEKQRGQLLSDFSCSNIHLKDKETNAELGLDVETRILLSPKSVTLPSLKVRRGASYLVASGILNGDTEALKFPSFEVNARSQLALESIYKWLSSSVSDLKTLPKFTGIASAEIKLAKAEGKKETAGFELRTEHLTIDNREIGTVQSSGSYKENEIHLNDTLIENPAGLAKIREGVIHLGEKITVHGKINLEKVALHDLLKVLKVGDIPVYLNGQAEGDCEAELRPDLHAECKPTMAIRDFYVKGSTEDKDKIAALTEAHAQGEVFIDRQSVRYKAQLGIGSSQGASEGVIDYEKGFNISFEGNPVSFQDLAYLVGLKLEGTTRVKGSTEGNTDHATFSMNLEGNDLWLDDFWIGNAKTNVRYKSGLITFKDLQGFYSTSRYFGEVSVDVHQKRINLGARIPFFDSKDLLAIFNRKVKLPFAVTGTGAAQVKVSGPLEFTALTYDLKSTMFRGTVAKETFDQAFFDIHSRNGEVTADRVQILKNKGLIQLSGVGHPNGLIDTVIHGKGLRLEDSAILNSTGLAIAGGLDFEVDMKGPVLTPNTEMQGQISKMSVGDQAVPDSKYRLKFSSKTLEGDGTFLGDVVKAAFVIPLNPQAPFALDFTASDWNYAPMFAALAGSSSRKDFDGRLSAKVQIASPSGGFWNSTGAITISQFFLKRGELSLKAPEPMVLRLNQGQAKVEKFYLEGDNTFLKLVEHTPAQSKIDLQVNGKLDMNLLFLLTPFLEELRGILSLAFNIRLGPNGSDFLGSAYIDRGYVKLFDLPHPFEELRADILFSQKKILVNSFNGELGGGRILGDGLIELKGYKNYPLQFNASMDKITLNIPDKVKTTGSGKVTVSGSWFPFLMKGNYDIHDGLYAQEFGVGSDRNSIRRSGFLPELLLQDNFVPLILDMQVGFERGIDVKNHLMDGKVLGQLNVKGNPSKPILTGKVTLDKDSKIKFKDTIFDVTDSDIQFNDPNEINPKLYLAARSRVQEYDVNMILQGFAAKPDIVLTSTPPMAQKDIISLLALGVTPDRPEGSITTQGQNPQQQQGGGSSALGSAILQGTQLNDEIKNRFGFQLQFTSGYDETGNVATQKVQATKQLSEKISVTAAQSVGVIHEKDAKAKLRLSKSLSLVGSWENQDASDVQAQQTSGTKDTLNKFGLDLEYKFEFK